MKCESHKPQTFLFILIAGSLPHLVVHVSVSCTTSLCLLFHRSNYCKFLFWTEESTSSILEAAYCVTSRWSQALPPVSVVFCQVYVAHSATFSPVPPANDASLDHRPRLSGVWQPVFKEYPWKINGRLWNLTNTVCKWRKVGKGCIKKAESFTGSLTIFSISAGLFIQYLEHKASYLPFKCVNKLFFPSLMTKHKN